MQIDTVDFLIWLLISDLSDNELLDESSMRKGILFSRAMMNWQARHVDDIDTQALIPVEVV